MKSIALKTFLLFSIVLLQGCMPDSLTKFKEETKPQKQPSSSGGVVAELPPESISYSSSNFKYIRNNPIIPVLPTTTGVVESFSITPGLPAGMIFDTSTGRIYGTPTTYSPENSYIVTATNSVGSITTTIQISVFTQPSGFRFTSTPKVKITLDDSSAFFVGSPISVQPLNGTVLSGTVTQILGNTLEVSVVSASTGTPASPVAAISRQVDDAATYVAGIATITDFDYTSKVQITTVPSSAIASLVVNSPVSNSSGALGQVIDLSSSTALIGVLNGSFAPTDQVDDAIAFATSIGTVDSVNYVYTPGDQIDLRPVVTNGEAITYSISPNLPASFTSFAPASGFIQGTQNGTTSLSFTITATNPIGSVATSLSIGPFIAPPENLSLSNELLLTVNNNSNFFRGRPVSSSSNGRGVILKKFGDGKTILIRHQAGAFSKDDSIDDSLTYGGEEAVIQKSESVNLALTLASSAGFENHIGKVATSSTGGQGLITFIDGNDIYLKYLSGTFSDTSSTAASTFNIAALTQNILAVKSTNLRASVTGASPINTRFDKGFHFTSSNLSAGLVHEIVGTGTTASVVVNASKDGFDDGQTVDNYSPFISGEATINSISYEHAFYLYTTESTTINTSLPKGDNVTYSITPDLPAGLVLNSTTGNISGTPTEPSILKSYTLTAKNISNGLQQQSSHNFKLKVYDDFGIFNTFVESNSSLMHREGMGLNIESCRLTKDQLQNGRPYIRATVATPHTFAVGSSVSNQFGAVGTVEEIIQDTAIAASETLIIRVQSGVFSNNQSVDDAATYVATAATLTNVHRRDYNKDIACRLEVSENDLWALGAKFKISSGKGICDYITYKPYYYYKYPAHQTSNTIVIKEVDSSGGLCPGSFAFANEQTDFKCSGDWSDGSLGVYSGPNCDEGTYVARTITWNKYDHDGDPDTAEICNPTPQVTDTTVNCGGNRYACLSGGARELPEFKPESGTFSVQLETSQGADREMFLRGPQDLSPLRSTNRYLANYVGNNSCAQGRSPANEVLREGKTYNYSIENWLGFTDYNFIVDTGLTVNGAVTNSATITTSADPTPFVSPGMSIRIAGVDYKVSSVNATTITLFARAQSIADTESIYVTSYKNDPMSGASPFYQIECRDPGAEVIGRIYLQIREWDRFFSPEDDVDVLSQRLLAGTVDVTAGGTSIASTGGADNDVFAQLNNNNDQRLITAGIENFTVDFVDNFSGNALDFLQISTDALNTQAGVSSWIRPLKQDSGDGIDSFGADYNDFLDWDDSHEYTDNSGTDLISHPGMLGCSVGPAASNFIINYDNFPFPKAGE